MFESAEIGHAIDKETYDAAVPALREALPAHWYGLAAVLIALARVVQQTPRHHQQD